MNNVVAAIIKKNNQFLIVQRNKNKHLGLKWEFPGGKVQESETFEKALLREINEELNITIIIHEKIAEEKYKDDNTFSFFEGSFENIPLPDKSVDHIVSTLALHWVKSLKVAASEMRRVLRDDGYLDILMIAKDDGAEFKKSIVAALKKHLSFKQIMGTANLVQRARADQVYSAFSAFDEGYNIVVEEYRDVVYGTFDEHMKWWSARSTPVIAEVEDKEAFMKDLRDELDKTNTNQGIPFDTAYFHILVRSKANG